LKSIIQEIKYLTNLAILNLSSNQIEVLPPEIGQLIKLSIFSINNNRLSVIPTEIGQLKELIELYIENNKLNNIPSEIGKLTKLSVFFLGGNKLTTLPTEIENLKSLTKLSLARNQFRKIPSFIGSFSEMTELYLYENQLDEIPIEIENLKKLTKLSLHKNQLCVFPIQVCNLKELKELYLYNNQLKALPSETGELRHLTKLGLNYNQIAILPPEIGSLNNLTELYLYGNHLSSLPIEIENLKQLNKLNLKANPLSIPIEILDQIEKPDMIINHYLESIKSTEQKPLREAKMLLVGQGGVGKTQIVNRLLYDTYNETESKTDGIAIKKLLIKLENKAIKVNIWDFGGQEIMYSTHKFFMTKRSLYLFVWDARQEDRYGQIDYWLKSIQSVGGDSPVIVVLNKCDVGKIDLDRRELQNKYPNIRKFIRISCKTRDNIDELAKIIKNEIAQLPHIEDEIPNNWFEIKEYLEKMTYDYIEYQDYEKLCEGKGLKKQEQEGLIRFLHDLGVVLNFRENIHLKDTNILNPEWVTNGVYKILTYPSLADSGILQTTMLNEILNSQKYPSNKHHLISDMMRMFELCFDFDTQKGEYLIPELLPKQSPELGWDYQDSLSFQYHYDFFPMSIISRFIVRMHRLIFKNTYWKSGVVLADNYNKALVKADRDERKVYIWVSGQEPTRRDFLSKIRIQFDEIHATIPKIEVAEKVPLPEYPDIVVDYDHLLNLEEMGQETFVPIGLKKIINVRQLLEGVGYKRSQKSRHRYPFDEVDEKEEQTRKPSDNQLSNVIHIHQSDVTIGESKKEIKEMAAISVQLGDGATIHGDFVVANRIRDSFNKADSSNASDELKNLLKTLASTAGKIIEKLPKEQAEQVATDLQILINEATSEKPRRRWWELSADGIKEAAVAVGEIGTSVITSLDKILPILDNISK